MISFKEQCMTVDQTCPFYPEDKKIKSSFPFGKCKVCNDRATGIHYGIASCEGCKVLPIKNFQKFYFFFNRVFLNEVPYAKKNIAAILVTAVL